MVSGRVLGVIGCLLTAAGACWAQSATLTEPIAAGDCFHVQMEMKLTGQMRVSKAGDALSLKMEAEANHELRERVALVGRRPFDTTSVLRRSSAARRGRDAAEAGVGHLSRLLALGFRWLCRTPPETTS